MGVHLRGLFRAKQVLRKSLLAAITAANVPKGHVVVYVGESEKKRFLVPIAYLNHPSFQDLLTRAEEEFGFHHPMGGLTIPCHEDAFADLTCRLNGL